MRQQNTWRVACHGAVVSRAFHVRTQPDLDLFKVGDILIARQTDVNYASKMLIAAAVITEEGGRYSHAAIFCRENGIPCIVGVVGALRELPNFHVVSLDTAVPAIDIILDHD